MYVSRYYMCTAPLTCGQSSIRSVKHKLHSSSHGPLAKSKFPMEGERESYVRQCHHGDAYEFWQNHQNVLCCMLIYPRPILVIVDCPSKQDIFISHSWHHHFCWASIPLHYPCTLQRFYITSNHGSKFALNFHFLGTALDMCQYSIFLNFGLWLPPVPDQLNGTLAPLFNHSRWIFCFC